MTVNQSAIPGWRRLLPTRRNHCLMARYSSVTEMGGLTYRSQALQGMHLCSMQEGCTCYMIREGCATMRTGFGVVQCMGCGAPFLPHACGCQMWVGCACYVMDGMHVLCSGWLALWYWATTQAEREYRRGSLKV